MEKLGDIVAVMVGVAVNTPYSYKLPLGFDVKIGSIVLVPLGTRQTLGVVWGTPKDNKAHNRLKDIIKVFDCEPLSKELIKTIDFIALYTLAPKGMVLRAALPPIKALEKPKNIKTYQLGANRPDRITPARAKILTLLKDGQAFSKAAIIKNVRVSASVVEGLIKQDVLKTVELAPPAIVEIPNPDFAPPTLNQQQQIALDSLQNQKIGFGVTLLDGVTGGGKTQVFFEQLADTLRAGKQSLIILPEIALTKMFIERFTKRFGVEPAQWHSAMSEGQKNRVWRGVMDGSVRAVIGARSSLFLPFNQLALIVIDEEHDGAFKQSDGIIYHARDMAIVRAKFANAKIILSSATPSIESKHNALIGKYHSIQLNSRFADAAMPDINLIDMKINPPEKGNYISPILEQEIHTCIEKGEQALLFLNRRGYAPLTLCKACGYQYQCQNCSTWLVEHRLANILMCHHCGLTIKKPKNCTQCDEEDSLIAIGPGIERVAEEAQRLFPDARKVILSSDIGSSELIKQRLVEIENDEYDLIIGTQLIAKGHHFEKLTLVGVLDADLGLDHGDPRAAEKTFQILTQVSGRSGRAAKAGKAYLQTYYPDHPVMRAMKTQDSKAFYAHELKIREQGGLPPFGRLAAIIISANNHNEAFNYARGLLRVAPKPTNEGEGKNLKLFGPVDAPLALIRGRYRVRLLVQSNHSFNLSAYMRFWLEKAQKPTKSIRVQVDIDPISFH